MTKKFKLIMSSFFLFFIVNFHNIFSMKCTLKKPIITKKEQRLVNELKSKIDNVKRFAKSIQIVLALLLPYYFASTCFENKTLSVLNILFLFIVIPYMAITPAFIDFDKEVILKLKQYIDKCFDEQFEKCKKNFSLNFDQKHCTICMEDFVKYDKLFILPCNHFFCYSCLKEKNWFYDNKFCPLCRRQFTEEELEKIFEKQIAVISEILPS